MIRRAPADEYPHRDWDELIAVNLTAVFRLSQLAGQDLLKRGAKGKIRFHFREGFWFRHMPRLRAA